MSSLGKYLIFILLSLFLLSGGLAAQNQEPADSLVRLIDARSAQLLEINGHSYRKVTGPARFLHNNTYMLCDTALWNVDTRTIDAIGNVSIIQDGTILESDKMKYLIDDNLAQFRGSLVELRDSDHNTLRTRHLDYNTQDSVAVFRDGAAMRDKDGQVIESDRGTYDSKIKTFVFNENVNMFTDSIFIKTSRLKYESDLSLATFGHGTDAWQEGNMLSSDAGWYDRARELFLFRSNVHVMTDTQEGWSDSLYFNRAVMNVEMLGNAQVTDTTRNISAVAGRIMYVDSLSRVTMTRTPAVVSAINDENGRDSVYFGADMLSYYTKERYLVDSAFVVTAEKRLADLEVDPVSTYRQKSRETAAKAAEEAAQNDPAKAAQANARKKQEAAAKKAEEAKKAGAENAAAASDSVAVAADSPAVADTLAVPEKDTTRIGFLSAVGNVRIYRKNMQVVCDSLEYSDIDSLARLFKEPVIWNEAGRHQYAADSITAVMRGGGIEKASLMSEAFIHVQEDTLHYDQIKSTEMIAYFNDNGGLARFDALGGALAMFYIEENDALATVNKKDTKMLSAIFKDGTIHKIYYFDTVKSDAYPVVQLSEEDRRLKGFRWAPEKRPKDRYAVTSLELRPLERRRYMARPRAEYVQTNLYFPGYIDDIYLQIAVRDSLERVRERERAIEEDRMKQEEVFRADSLAKVHEISVRDSIEREKFIADSLSVADSLGVVRDSLSRADSLATADSLSAARVLTKKEIREKKAQERLKRKEERIKAREAKWAEKDKADSLRREAKEAEKLAKQRRHKLQTLQEAADQAAADNARIERYKQRMQKKKQRRSDSKVRSGDALKPDSISVLETEPADSE